MGYNTENWTNARHSFLLCVSDESGKIVLSLSTTTTLFIDYIFT